MTLGMLLRHELHDSRWRFRQAAMLAALVSGASIALLGLSGWFITASALAGAAGVATALAFNYLLPAVAIRLLAIVRTGARYGERVAGHDAALSVMARIRPRLFRAVASAPPTRALALSNGDATARLIDDVEAIETRLVFASARWGALTALGFGALLVVVAGWSAAIFVVAVALVVLGMGRGLGEALENRGAAVQQAASDFNDTASDWLASAAELRCYGIEHLAETEIRRAGAMLAEARIADSNTRGWFDLIAAIAIGVAATGALMLAAREGAALAALAALAAAMVIDGLTPMLRQFAQRGAATEAARRLDQLFESAEQLGVAIDLQPTIEMGGRVFAPGDRILLDGRSGSGKSSLIERLIALRPGRIGDAKIGGLDIAFAPAETLRAMFAWMPQDAAMLSGTVRDNLSLAEPQADEARQWAALDDTMLADRVRRLPHGLDTWIGENGASLSGGERRRLALARAYLAQTPWLLLDEPTEGMDAALEQQICVRLLARIERTGQGLIFASHRRVLRDCATAAVPIGVARRDFGTIATTAI